MYEFIRDLHLYTIAPCLPLGFYLIIVSGKGAVLHKKIGYVYMVLIFFSAIVSLFLKAYVEPTFLNHFGWIHLLSLLTIWTVPRSLIAVKKGGYAAPQTRYEITLLDRPHPCWFIYTYARSVFT